MTNEAMRIAVAELCGWKKVRTGSFGESYGIDPQATNAGRLETPDYPNDLNAVAIAEHVLTDDQWDAYADLLADLPGRYPAIRASAFDRCDALLRATGRFVEEAKE